MNLKTQVKQILSRHEGRNRAITGKKIAEMCGYQDDRQIRLIIRDLISEGMPVASCGTGYFIVTSWQEAEEYAQSIKGRLIEDAIRRRDFRRAATYHLTPATQVRLI